MEAPGMVVAIPEDIPVLRAVLLRHAATVVAGPDRARLVPPPGGRNPRTPQRTAPAGSDSRRRDAPAVGPGVAGYGSRLYVPSRIFWRPTA